MRTTADIYVNEYSTLYVTYQNGKLWDVHVDGDEIELLYFLVTNPVACGVLHKAWQDSHAQLEEHTND
jgi:hypothetical protein